MDRDASGYWRSIARRVRDRAATGSTEAIQCRLNQLLLRKSFLTLDGIMRQLDPDFYRSGLPTRTLAAHFAGTIRKEFV